MKKDCIRDYVSILCEKLSVEPAIVSDVARDAFTQLSVDPVPTTPGHTHADAAALRSTATRFCQTMALFSGADVYVIGMSKSDQRKNMRGSRTWYWTKDANTSNRNDEVGRRDIRYMCDVDYYVDMPQLLAECAKPVVLYTVVPETATGNGIDQTSFRFESDGTFHTLVAGGGSYRHPLWDYAGDSVLAVKTCLGIPTRAIAYAIERKQVGKHRQMILLAPIKLFNGIAAILARMVLETKTLNRFDPIVTADGQSYVRFNVMTPRGELLITTARAGDTLSATVPASVDDSIATVARLGTTNLMLPTTASWITDRASAAILTEFHRKSQSRPKPFVFPVAAAVRAYQYKPKNFDADAKPKLQAFMSPLVHGAFAPVPNRAGEEQCVEGRINSLKKPEPPTNTFRDHCLIDFVNIISQGKTLEPVCYETVEHKQTRGAQKLSLMKAVLTGPFRKRILKCFIKSEAYADVKDPRNISTYNDADKLDMAMFALALSDHLKQFPWYGPGKTPKQIAERVAVVCSAAKTFLNTSDYHRMDGTISYWLRLVERGVAMKMFSNHTAVMNELLKRNVDNTGFLPEGTTFDQGSSHGSGCSATSVFQTLRAAFNAYLAFRHTILPGTSRFYNNEEAFEALGLHYGDDGIDADLPVESLSWASKNTGLVVESDVVLRGYRGVNFLARYYSPDVWYGDTNSMCDIKRQLSKFHTTVRMPQNVAPLDKLVEKAMSYSATDGNTPVIGQLCGRVLLLTDYRPRHFLGVGNWWTQFDATVQFPNENVGGWMDVEFDALFPEFDRRVFDEWLVGTGTAEELLSAPLCAEPKPATPTSVAVVVDETVLAPRETAPALAQADNAQDTVQPQNGRPRYGGRQHHRNNTQRRGISRGVARNQTT